MKVFLIHGDDNKKSYIRLSSFIDEAKRRSWEVVFLDESQLNIRENISSISLFGSERFLIHRNISKVSLKDLEWIKKSSDKYTGNLVFYADDTTSKTVISKLPKDTKIEEFKLPVLLWKFLDSFYPGNSITALKLLDEIVPGGSVELVFGLLARQVRDLYWVKKDPTSLGYPSWRLGKLKSQADKFKKGVIEEVVNDLASIDIKSKTSVASLKDLLDFIVINRLQ